MFQFDSLADFLTMDGHGIYVWTSYAITLMVMAWVIARPVRRARRLRQVLARERRRLSTSAAPGSGDP